MWYEKTCNQIKTAKPCCIIFKNRTSDTKHKYVLTQPLKPK